MCPGCLARKLYLNRLWPGLGSFAESFFHHVGVDRFMAPQKTTWACGVTTVPSRYTTTLPTTLLSLQEAGFTDLRLFVDSDVPVPVSLQKMPTTYRGDNIKTVGHWFLTLVELMIRSPHADRYAIFQDDFVAYRNLRQYLEQTPYPSDGYLNLYTFPENEKLCKGEIGFHLSNQKGRGAVALVFSRKAAEVIATSRHMINKPRCKKRGTRAVDGGILEAAKIAGWKEYVHYPSLIQHIGKQSSMGNAQHPLAPSFLGEEFDALDLLPRPQVSVPTPVRPAEPTPPEPEAPSVPDLVQPVTEETPVKHKIGIVGHNGHSSIDVSRHSVALLDADVWLQVDTEAPPEGVATVATSGRKSQLAWFCNQVDTVVFFDTPVYPLLLEEAKRRHVQVCCVLTAERPIRPESTSWMSLVDLFICPSRDVCEMLWGFGYNAVEHSWPKTEYPDRDTKLREALEYSDFSGLQTAVAETLPIPSQDEDDIDDTLLDC